MKKLAPTSYVLAFFCLFLLFPSPVRAMEGYSSLPPSFAGIASLILWILLTSAIKFGISFLSLPLDKKARLVFAAATLGIQTFQFVLLYFESGRFADSLSSFYSDICSKSSPKAPCSASPAPRPSARPPCGKLFSMPFSPTSPSFSWCGCFSA